MKHMAYLHGKWQHCAQLSQHQPGILGDCGTCSWKPWSPWYEGPWVYKWGSSHATYQLHLSHSWGHLVGHLEWNHCKLSSVVPAGSMPPNDQIYTSFCLESGDLLWLQEAAIITPKFQESDRFLCAMPCTFWITHYLRLLSIIWLKWELKHFRTGSVPILTQSSTIWKHILNSRQFTSCLRWESILSLKQQVLIFILNMGWWTKTK